MGVWKMCPDEVKLRIMIEQGFSTNVITKEMGVSHIVVRRWADAQGMSEMLEQNGRDRMNRGNRNPTWKAW